MSGDGVNLRKAVEQTVSDGPRTHWFSPCGCTETFTGGCCEEAIAERQREANKHELWYGDPDNFDPDR